MVGKDLLLFQRGNTGATGDPERSEGPSGATRHKDRLNAVIRTGLAQALAALRKGTGKLAFRLQPYDLGAIDGVPLGFTDAAPLPGGAVLFTAAAEATDNAYDDGACRGSAIGLLDARGASNG